MNGDPFMPPKHFPLAKPNSPPVVASRFLSCLFALPGLAVAQQTTAPEVVVTATRMEEKAFDLPVAIDVLPAATIRNSQWEVNASEALVRIPGVSVQNRQAYAQDIQVSSRGFGARAQFGVRGIRLIADDIPTTMPDGQGTTGNFDLSSASRIEVLRGPFSALYGNHSGGVIQLFTEDGPAKPMMQGSVAAGSYGSQRLGLKAGGQSGQVNYLISAAAFETDGYREHSAAKRNTGNAKLRIDLGADDKLTLVANTLDQPDNQDPLGLTAQQMSSDPRQASPVALSFDTRRSLTNTQGGMNWEHRLNAADAVRATVWYGQRENEQYQAIPLATQNGARHSGGVAAIDRNFAGSSLRWTHRIESLNWAVGADYETMTDDRKGYLNLNGIKGSLKRDEENRVNASGIYGQAEWSPTIDWTLAGGMRRSRVDFRTEDHFITGTNPDDSGSVKFSQTTPTIGVVHKINPQLNVYANLGRGFETPTNVELAYRADGVSGPNLDLRPAISDSGEVGVKAIVGEATKANFALFSIRTRDEIVVVFNQGGRAAYQNAARSRRQGAELSLETSLPAGFSTYVAATWLDARYAESFQTCTATPCNPATSTGTSTVAVDNRIPGVAQRSAFAELTWKQPAWGFETSLEWRYNDKVWVNDMNTEAAASYSLFNAQASLRQRTGGWTFSEFLRVDNLGDRAWVSGVLVGDGNGRYYAPGPARNALAGASVRYDF
jgi:iron complex outermembrane recepter protein